MEVQRILIMGPADLADALGAKGRWTVSMALDTGKGTAQPPLSVAFASDPIIPANVPNLSKNSTSTCCIKVLTLLRRLPRILIPGFHTNQGMLIGDGASREGTTKAQYRIMLCRFLELQCHPTLAEAQEAQWSGKWKQ